MNLRTVPGIIGFMLIVCVTHAVTPLELVGEYVRAGAGDQLRVRLILSSDGRWRTVAASEGADMPLQGEWRIRGMHLLLHRDGDNENSAGILSILRHDYSYVLVIDYDDSNKEKSLNDYRYFKRRAAEHP